MKNGGKNKSIAFIILFCMYVYIYIYLEQNVQIGIAVKNKLTRKMLVNLTNNYKETLQSRQILK